MLDLNKKIPAYDHVWSKNRKFLMFNDRYGCEFCEGGGEKFIIVNHLNLGSGSILVLEIKLCWEQIRFILKNKVNLKIKFALL